MDYITESEYKELRKKIQHYKKNCEGVDIPCAVCGERSTSAYKPMIGRRLYVCNDHKGLTSYVGGGHYWFAHNGKEIELTHLDEQSIVLKTLISKP